MNITANDVNRARGEFEAAKLANPSGCKCDICGELVPWDEHMILKHFLSHDENLKGTNLTWGQRQKLKAARWALQHGKNK